ncbi:MAG: flippase [Symploca sp. SIO3E6]|nr:flippase [Caldora sp. SIO3E6]
MSKTSTAPAITYPGIHLQSLAHETVIALSIQIGGFLLAYLLQVFLARGMGETEYGVYAYVISWALLLSCVADLGFPDMVLRFVSEYKVQEASGMLRGVIQGSWFTVAAIGIGLSLIGTGVIWLMQDYVPFLYKTPLLIGVWLVPLFALHQLQLETARSLGDITLAYAPYRIFWPVLVAISAIFLLESHYELAGSTMLGIAAFTMLSVVILQFWLVQQRLNQTVEVAAPIYAFSNWIKVAAALWLMNAFLIIMSQTDIIVVGSLLGPEQAGIYTVGVKTAAWVSFVLGTVNMVTAPSFAQLYKQDKQEELQQLVTTSSIWIFWPSLIVAALIIIFAPNILSFFGMEFLSGSLLLRILVVAHLINSLFGSVCYLMIMTGHQNQSLVVSAVAAGLNLVLNCLAVPLLGAVGAAIVSLLTMTLWNVWLSILVFKHLNIKPSVFAVLF